jgi:hypothetical protein
MKRRIGEERKEGQGAGGEKKVKKEDDGGIEGEEDIVSRNVDHGKLTMLDRLMLVLINRE